MDTRDKDTISQLASVGAASAMPTLAPNEVLVRAYVLDTLPEDMWPSTRYSIEVAPRCFRCHQGISHAAKNRVKFLVTFVASIPTHAVKLCVPCAEHILTEDS